MANYPEQFTLKVNEIQKEFTNNNNKDLFRDLINIAMKYTDNDLKDLNIQILMLENEINDLQDRLNKNINDIDYYNQRIKEKSDINKKYTDIINEKNVKIRDLLDMQEKQTKEYELMYYKALKLMEEFNNLNKEHLNGRSFEPEFSELIDNNQYCTPNNIIDYIIGKLDDKKYIDILKTCKR